MMKKPVSELTGPELAEWVARAQGWDTLWIEYQDRKKLRVAIKGNMIEEIGTNEYRPDIDGTQAMELAKRMGLLVNFSNNMVWTKEVAPLFGDTAHKGDTPEISICRAVVASKFGEFVEMSDEQ